MEYYHSKHKQPRTLVQSVRQVTPQLLPKRAFLPSLIDALNPGCNLSEKVSAQVPVHPLSFLNFLEPHRSRIVPVVVSVTLGNTRLHAVSSVEKMPVAVQENQAESSKVNGREEEEDLEIDYSEIEEK